jgi:hypothetical protein
MDYWEECITEAFDDAGIEATKEQIDTVTSWVDGAHENYGMAFGHDCIPNPMESEVEKLKAHIKMIENAHDNMIFGIKKGVAKRRNVSPQDVHIDDSGHVTYDLL